MATADLLDGESLTPDERVFLFGVGWDGYETMLKLVGERSRPRVTYHQGNVELMEPSAHHDVFGYWIDRVFETAAVELGIPFRATGRMTWRRQSKDCGLQADASFYVASLPLIREKRKTIDLNVDPPPDLAIEVQIGTGRLDRMAIYAALGVPEVWRFDGWSLQVLQLQANDTYALAATSWNLSALSMDDVVRWVRLGEAMEDYTEWHRQFVRWFRESRTPAKGIVKQNT